MDDQARKKEPLDIREIQSVSLEILKRIADLCEELGIRYYLLAGTLIGAVRHQGFIPWDDDIDIMMPRPDYDILIEYLTNNKLTNLTLFNRNTCPDYPYMISRISDDRYLIEAENEKSIGMGIFIDIYPLDGMGHSLKQAIRYGMLNDWLASLCFQASRKRFAIETTKGIWKQFIKRPMFWFAQLCGKDVFQNAIEKRRRKYDYESSEWVGDLVWLSGGKEEIFNKKWIEEYLVVPFDKYEFRIPKGYDELLKQAYGNYMELPPPEERIGHHYYLAYKR